MPVIKTTRGIIAALAALCIAVLFITGCDELDSLGDNAAKRPVSGADVPPQVDPQMNAARQSQPTSAAKSAPAAAAADPNAPTTLQPGQEKDPSLQKATAGVGKQGQGYGGGLITEPVHQFFKTRDRITFDIQIVKQLQVWKAMNNNRNPKDFVEYKKEILDPCQVELPELPQGKRYIYDPKSGELLVGWGDQ